jgi:hypothetical protein
MLRIGLAAILLLVAVQTAQAAFVAAPLAVALLPAALVPLGTFVGSMALAFGASYVAGLLLAKDEPTLSQGGAGGNQIDLRVDAEVPRSLIVGTAPLGGSLVYAQTYGSRGEIDNSDLIEIVAVADHPCTELVTVFLEGKEVTWTPASLGRQGIVGYDEKVFFRFYDGTQTTADTFAVNNLGTHSSQPWTSAMVGRGITYAMLHLKYHQKKVTGPLQWKFVVKGIKLYDPRKDTTVGGSGAHRFDTLSTHEWTDNPMVIAYNILRGIYAADSAGVRQHFYGLERTAADQLPLTEWFAAMNACDEDMSGSDTTNRYRCGGEITVDTEPREAIQELLKCCGGRIVELGGVYKPYIDTPELPVYAFTDDDVLDEEDSFRPIMPLEQRVNYVTGSYTHPTRWNEKVAPPRIDLDLEAEDGRRLPADLNAPFVQYGPQMQRLMRQYLKRARRFRKHKLSLPPSAFGIEPGQVVEWDSDRNGYVSKLFEIDAVEYHGNLCVTVTMTEVDPNDYDWDDAFKLPESEGPLPSTIPEPKVIGGFSASGITVGGDLGTNKPGIELTWTDPQDADVSMVKFQLRRPSQPLIIKHDHSTEPEAGKMIIVGGLAPLTEYEIRAKFDSKNDYDADWSLWIPVTTPDARLSLKDFIEGLRHEVTDGIEDRMREVRDNIEMLAGLLAELQSADELNKTEVVRKLEKTRDNLRAAFTETIALELGPAGAIGLAIQSLEVQMAEISASGAAQFLVGVTPAGAIAGYDLTLKAEGAKAGMSLVAKNVAGVKTGQIRFDADSVLFGKSGSDSSFKTIFVVDTSTTPPRVLLDGNLLAAGSIKAAALSVAKLASISADLGKVTAGEMLFQSSAGQIQITSNPPRILISEFV